MSLVTTLRDLHRRKARERRGLALAEGIRLVEEMLRAGVPCRGAVWSPSLEATPRGTSLLAELHRLGVPLEPVADAEMASIAATEQPQGIVAAYAPPAWQLDGLLPSPGRPLLLLDGVQDPGNAGTIARTALAFGASGLIALPGTVDLTNPKVVRSAAGALFQLPHLHADTEAVVEMLAGRDVEVWATTMDGEPLPAPPSSPVALLLGNEGAGIEPELLDTATRKVMIPISDAVESLNVAIAAGIILHHLGQP